MCMTQVEEVRGQIDKISSEVDEVRKRHSMILSAPNPDQKMKDELDLLTNEIKGNANSVRVKLESVFPLSSPYLMFSLTPQHTVLSRKFVDVMTQYNETQVSFRERSKGRIQRQLEISQSQTGLAIISDSQITRQALNEIESRHQDIIRLESSIREFHGMFMDMAMLVENQGDMVNNIEKNVSNAAEYIGRAKEETKKAVRYQKKSQRKLFIFGFVLFILLAVIALIVGLSVGLTKSPV
uniref:Syntaxin 2b n=1 Tax=Hucho hucho TaxID=62062 RepID=A0A4W5N8N2_9TELE